MISKKNKALVAGILAAATSASAIMPAMGSAAENSFATENGANESYAAMFESLYEDVITNGQQSGYLSAQNNGGDSFGIPYHAKETVVVEAPDYGHETTSEAMSYIAWVTAMHDVLVKQGAISGSEGDLAKGWKTLEAIIPGWSEASGINKTIKYESLWTQPRLKADTAKELDLPQQYPTSNAGVDAINPLFEEMKSNYSGDKGYYLMHWLADVDDWYGFGDSGKFTFINTFQRGEQESCFETVPHPCIEELKHGNTSDGIKGIFNGVGNVSPQYAFTNAPDAEDRAIQAIYFANQWGVDCGELSGLAGKMGDQCRNDMFDKYYHAIGCQDIMSSGSAGTKSQHYLMAWYTSWGGALDKYDWAWQIGCSHSHQFYQNPLAAYALVTDEWINSGMQSKQATADYEESLKRQVEMYLWLQSVEGPFAGGCTNSYRGRYETYPDGYPTFYDMVYVPHPVYADPGSNHWIGNQVWSTQRLAELYYYVVTKGDKSNVKPAGMSLEEALDILLERWISWFEENTHFNYTTPDGKILSYCIPSNLDWGDSDTDYSCAPDTWTGKYDPNGNQNLHCEITGYGQGDVGCVSSLCNTLIYYAAAKKVPASEAYEETAKDDSIAAKGLRLANKLLSAQWNEGRDDIGIAFEDCNGSLTRIFKEPVYIPTNYKGTMPDGSKLENGATFISIRESYRDDPMFQELEAAYEASGKTSTEDFKFRLHRFWHMGDALMSYGGMALLYPDVKPIGAEDITPGPGPELPDATLWGDTNCDGEVLLNDAILILQNLGNPDEYKITDQGKANADVYENGTGLTNSDSLQIQKYLLKLVASLDPKDFVKE